MKRNISKIPPDIIAKIIPIERYTLFVSSRITKCQLRDKNFCLKRTSVINQVIKAVPIPMIQPFLKKPVNLFIVTNIVFSLATSPKFLVGRLNN